MLIFLDLLLPVYNVYKYVRYAHCIYCKYSGILYHFELTVYVHKFNCDGDVLVVIISSNVAGLFRGDDGFMIDNAFSECLLDTNDNGLLSISNVLFCIIIIIHLLQLL